MTINENKKRCPSCSKNAGTDVFKNKAEFSKSVNKKDGLDSSCKECEKDRKKAFREAKKLQSKYLPLGKENYTSHNDDDSFLDKSVEQMGAINDLLTSKINDDANSTKKLGQYMSGLIEDERRFINRRLSKSVSLSVARDHLSLQNFKMAAEEYLKGKIVASGYATKTPKEKHNRVLNVLLSDLHFGSALGRDNPVIFGPEEESRRFAKIVAEVCDWKPHYRSDTKLHVYLNGDLIEGLLLHDLRDGDPLTEQMVAFWKYMGAAMAQWSKVFPKVLVEFQPGNHGRNRLRHPGRATSSKWDGEETKMVIALSMMSTHLKNVTFKGCGFDHLLPFSTVELPGGHYLGLTHGDTELKLGDPDNKAKENISELANVNATLRYGKKLDAFAFGHFHKGRTQHPLSFSVIWNPALVPPNGHARTSGYGYERCGQYIWESVEGYPVGDIRFLEVGPSEDKDASLNKIIPPFRFEK